MKNSDLFFVIIRLPLDFLMLVAAGLATYLFRTEIISAFRPVLFEFNLPLDRFMYLVFLVSILFLAAYAVSGLYSLKLRMGLAEEFFKIAIASSAGIMIVIIYIFFRQELFNSRFLVLGGWLMGIIFVFLGRLAVRSIQNYLGEKYNFGIKRALVVGIADSSGQYLTDDVSAGYKVVRYLPALDMAEVSRVIKSGEIDKVILADTNYPAELISDLIDSCHENYISFKYVPSLHSILAANFDIDMVNGLPLIEVKRTALGGWGGVIKRFIDIVFSSLALLLLVPSFLVVALLIRLDSEGPVFVGLIRFSQGKLFRLYKFRSMVRDAEELKAQLAAFNERQDGPLFKMHNDPRVTRVGRIIRRFRIDELPQFWNVLKGEISLVGPRPHQPDEIAQYQRHHRKVLAIKSGATGLAQISGSSDLPFEEEVALDSYYIDNWSIGLDFKIILRTAFKMISDRSAV